MKEKGNQPGRGCKHSYKKMARELRSLEPLIKDFGGPTNAIFKTLTICWDENKTKVEVKGSQITIGLRIIHLLNQLDSVAYS